MPVNHASARFCELRQRLSRELASVSANISVVIYRLMGGELPAKSAPSTVAWHAGDGIGSTRSMIETRPDVSALDWATNRARARPGVVRPPGLGRRPRPAVRGGPRQPVGLEDLERLAIAAHLIGRYGESAKLSVRSYQDSMRAGDVGRAARSAFWIAVEHLGNGELAPAAGWLAKAERLVGSEDRRARRAGLSVVAAAARSLAEGEPANRAGDIRRGGGDRCRVSPTRTSWSWRGSEFGEALIALHQTARGIGLMDEAMASVTAGEVSPVMAGIVYCSVIASCQQVFDLRRAQEWTSALDRWCASQPQLVQFRGQCLLNRAVLMQFHGAWQDAAAQALRAIERLADPRPIRRSARRSTRRPSSTGCAARLSRPKMGTAARSSSADGRSRAWPSCDWPRAGPMSQPQPSGAPLTKPGTSSTAPGCLEPMVDIMLAAGSTTAARAAADELSQIASEFGAPLLAAMAARADGAVLLSEGKAQASLAALRQAWTAWHSLDAPYEAARVRVLIGRACRELGDVDTAAMELDAARDVFERLGATPDLARLKPWSTRQHRPRQTA